MKKVIITTGILALIASAVTAYCRAEGNTSRSEYALENATGIGAFCGISMEFLSLPR